jgi:hypothetical protein
MPTPCLREDQPRSIEFCTIPIFTRRVSPRCDEYETPRSRSREKGGCDVKSPRMRVSINVRRNRAGEEPGLASLHQGTTAKGRKVLKGEARYAPCKRNPRRYMGRCARLKRPHQSPEIVWNFVCYEWRDRSPSPKV